MAKKHYLEVGGKYLIQTVNFIFLGEVVSLEWDMVEMKSTSIIYDTGKLVDFLKSGKANASEYFNETIYFQRANILTIIPWKRELPTESNLR